MIAATIYAVEWVEDTATGSVYVPTLAEAKRVAAANCDRPGDELTIRRLRVVGADGLRAFVCAVANHAGFVRRSDVVGWYERDEIRDADGDVRRGRLRWVAADPLPRTIRRERVR